MHIKHNYLIYWLIGFKQNPGWRLVNLLAIKVKKWKARFTKVFLQANIVNLAKICEPYKKNYRLSTGLVS